MKNKNNNKSTLGWVVRDIATDMYVNRDSNYGFTRKLKNARVFGSRSVARTFRDKGTETVDKVTLAKNTPVTVIGGHWE